MTNKTRTDAASRRVALHSPVGFLAFGFGSGLSPVAPGTVGTLVAVPVALLLHQLPLAARLALLAVLFVAGIRICTLTSRRLGQHDPGGIVWDEIVAFCLVVAWLPPHWGWWGAAFVLFRVFDILKPWPIRYLEKAVGGGLGIMLDDIVAAGYAVLCLAGLRQLL